MKKMKKKRTNESQAEKFSGRRREILRTERRNSPDGAENGSASTPLPARRWVTLPRLRSS